jgi:hypothetical protein
MYHTQTYKATGGFIVFVFQLCQEDKRSTKVQNGTETFYFTSFADASASSGG